MMSEVLSNFSIVKYYFTEDGIGFVTGTKDKGALKFLKMENEAEEYGISTMFSPNIFIENDTLFFHLGDYSKTNFEFGLRDLTIITFSLYDHNSYNFTVVYNKEQPEFITKTFKLSQRQKEVIKSYVLQTYSAEVNLKDKFGEFVQFETLRENQLSAIEQTIKYKKISVQTNLKEYIARKYNLDSIDTDNKTLMNEILDYALEKFVINVIPIGFCIHFKKEFEQCEEKNCSVCKGC